MSVENFLDRIEATGLINPALMAELRKRAGESTRRLRPEMIAKLLVDRGELTAAQARKLVMDDLASPEVQAEPEEDIFTGEPVASSFNDDLTLASDEQNDSRPASSSHLDTELTLADDDESLSELDDTPEAVLVDEEEDTPEAVNDDLVAAGLRDILEVPVQGGDPSDDGKKLRRGGSIFSNLFGGRQKKGGRKNRWDSPLILLGGGGLILLVAAGVGIFSLLYSESVDEIYAAGEEAYQSQAYGVAIEKFERLATKYPQHENASLARVRIELAKLRQFTDAGSPDWTAAYDQARQGLPSVATESAFADVRAELAKLLPDITNGLVEQSGGSDQLDQKKQLLGLAQQSLELVHDPVYLPTTVKKTQELRIEGIEANMDIVSREIERQEALASAAQQIKDAASSGRIVEAYALRDDLVAKYPILIGNPTLNDALGNVADKERAAVTVSDSQLKPERTDHAPVSRVQLVLSDRRGKPVADVDNQIYCILARGSVYALNVKDGSVRWRRFVGFETEAFPQRISDQADSDVLLVDGTHSELQRVSAATGELKWRLACSSPLSTPRIVGGRAFICSGLEDQSKLLAVDLNTGNVLKEIEFPVGCATTPGVIANGKYLAAPGLHSSLYVVDTESMQCTSVIPTSHRRGSMVTSPVWLGEMLIMAENTGVHSSQLQRYQQLKAGTWSPVAAPIALAGQTVSQPQVDARRLLSHTDQGEIRIFEVPLNSTELRELAMVDGTNERLGRAYARFMGSQIWIADQKLTRYQLQATRGELLRQLIRDRRDHFNNPIQRFGSYLLSVRQRHGMLGVTVAAHPAADQQGDPLWQTDLAVPSQVLVSSDDNVYAVTSNGALFPIDGDAVKSGVTDRRQARIDALLLPDAFSQMLPIAENEMVFASPAPITHIVRAELRNPSLNRVPLRIDSDVASCELVAFQGGLLAACETGPIHLLAARTGKPIVKPFVPRLEPGQKIDWLPPAATAGGQFMAAEKNGKLYLVEKQGTTLKVAKQAAVTGPLVAGLAAAGSTGFAVSNSAGSDELIAINSDLAVVNTASLHSGIAWGPQRVGDHVLVSDGAHTLSAFDDRGKSLWSANLSSPLAGPPLRQGARLIAATTNGTLTVLDATSGKVAAQETLSEPLGGGPVSYKGRLLVVGWDGTLFLVDVPQ